MILPLCCSPPRTLRKETERQNYKSLPAACCYCALLPFWDSCPSRKMFLLSCPDLEQSVVPVECCAFSLYTSWSFSLLESGSSSSLFKGLLNPGSYLLLDHGTGLAFLSFLPTVLFGSIDMIMSKVRSVCSFFQGSSCQLAKIAPWFPFLFLSILCPPPSLPPTFFLVF